MKLLLLSVIISKSCLLATTLLCLCQRSTAEGIRFRAVRAYVRARSYTKRSLARYLINRSWEFHQIYNLGAVGDEYEMIRFWGQRSRSQRAQMWSKSTFGILKLMVSKLTVTDSLSGEGISVVGVWSRTSSGSFWHLPYFVHRSIARPRAPCRSGTN